MNDKKPSITVTPRADESSWSADDVIAKRLSGQPFGVRTDEIPLREPGKWQLYVASSQGNEGRHYEMTHKKGWVPCSTADLPDGISAESIGFRVAEDGTTLVRGVRGEEVVYKMPKTTYDRLQRLKAADNVKGMSSPKAAQQDLAEAAAAAHGSEAADYISQHAQVTVRDTVTGG